VSIKVCHLKFKVSLFFIFYKKKKSFFLTRKLKVLYSLSKNRNRKKLVDIIEIIQVEFRAKLTILIIANIICLNNVIAVRVSSLSVLF